MSRETIYLAWFALFKQAHVTMVECLSLFLLALQSHKGRLRQYNEPLVFRSLCELLRAGLRMSRSYWRHLQTHRSSMHNYSRA
jgi:hypothetical protein